MSRNVCEKGKIAKISDYDVLENMASFQLGSAEKAKQAIDCYNKKQPGPDYFQNISEKTDITAQTQCYTQNLSPEALTLLTMESIFLVQIKTIKEECARQSTHDVISRENYELFYHSPAPLPGSTSIQLENKLNRFEYTEAVSTEAVSTENNQAVRVQEIDMHSWHLINTAVIFRRCAVGNEVGIHAVATLKRIDDMGECQPHSTLGHGSYFYYENYYGESRSNHQ